MVRTSGTGAGALQRHLPSLLCAMLNSTGCSVRFAERLFCRLRNTPFENQNPCEKVTGLFQLQSVHGFSCPGVFRTQLVRSRAQLGSHAQSVRTHRRGTARTAVISGSSASVECVRVASCRTGRVGPLRSGLTSLAKAPRSPWSVRGCSRQDQM